MKTIYLCFVTWPDGSEGLLFPRPGRVPVAEDSKQAEKDFEKAKRDLFSYAMDMWPPARKESIDGTSIRLIECQQLKVLKEFLLTSEQVTTE